MVRVASICALSLFLVACTTPPNVEVRVPEFPKAPEILMREPQQLKPLQD